MGWSGGGLAWGAAGSVYGVAEPEGRVGVGGAGGAVGGGGDEAGDAGVVHRIAESDGGDFGVPFGGADAGLWLGEQMGAGDDGGQYGGARAAMRSVGVS